MAKFHGIIGYIKTEETAPGVYTDVVTERACVGDILRNNQRWEQAERLNDNLKISNRFSIVADAYAYQNLEYIRYIKYNDTNWIVTYLEIERPRIVLNAGGVYNG